MYIYAYTVTERNSVNIACRLIPDPLETAKKSHGNLSCVNDFTINAIDVRIMPSKK